jgi:hypothetical protein
MSNYTEKLKSSLVQFFGRRSGIPGYSFHFSIPDSYRRKYKFLELSIIFDIFAEQSSVLFKSRIILNNIVRLKYEGGHWK